MNVSIGIVGRVLSPSAMHSASATWCVRWVKAPAGVETRQGHGDMKRPNRQSTDTDTGPISPWQLVSDPVDARRLSKLIEECGELVSVAARCLLQGLDGVNPDNDKPNRRWLEEEFADVMANMELVHERFKLDETFIRERADFKKERQRQWQPK